MLLYLVVGWNWIPQAFPSLKFASWKCKLRQFWMKKSEVSCSIMKFFFYSKRSLLFRKDFFSPFFRVFHSWRFSQWPPAIVLLKRFLFLLADQQLNEIIIKRYLSKKSYQQWWMVIALTVICGTAPDSVTFSSHSFGNKYFVNKMKIAKNTEKNVYWCCSIADNSI